MFDLDGKGALITGASGGIGGAIARTLHGCGAQVVLGGRNTERLAALAAELGEGAHVVEGDLARPEAAGEIVKQAESALGRVDILVNNAGLARDGLMMRMADEDWQEVLDVNLTGAFRLSRAALRGMIRQRWGRIITITSVVGTTGNPGQANYAASKAGLVGMTKALAAEVASRGITVNCIAPGFISTVMTESLSPEQKKKLLAAIPARRFGSPEEVAGSVAFLASDVASYITGQSLHVNGGMAMI